MCFCTEDSRAGCSTPDGQTGAEYRGRTNSLALLTTCFWCSWFLSCKGILLGPAYLFMHQYLQVFLGKATFCSFYPPACVDTGVTSTQVKLAFGLAESHQIFVSPLLRLVQDLPGGSCSSGVLTLSQLGVYLQICWEGTTVCVTGEDTGDQSHYRPLKDTTCHWSGLSNWPPLN